MSSFDSQEVFPHTPAPGQRVVYFVNSLVAVAAPAFLYHTIRGLPLEDFPIVYGVVFVVAAYFLSEAYHNRAQRVYKKAQHFREDLITKRAVKLVSGDTTNVPETVQKLKTEQATVTRHEAVAYAITWVNASFVFGYLLTNFLFAKSAVTTNFLLSTGLPAAALFYFA